VAEEEGAVWGGDGREQADCKINQPASAPSTSLIAVALTMLAMFGHSFAIHKLGFETIPL
jgi:hypothetical protein